MFLANLLNLLSRNLGKTPLSFLRFRLNLAEGHFHTDHTLPTGWTHIVLNYIGPNNEQGIRVFSDGAEVASDTVKDTSNSYPAGDGRIVVGRYLTNQDQKYASIQVDELIYLMLL